MITETTLDELVKWATLFAFVAAAWQLHASRKQRQRDFEALFVQRYWSIVDELTVSALAGVETHDGEIQEQDRRAVLAYLRLCEDEIELWLNGWISREAWHEWSIGIDMGLRRWPFSAVWAEVCAAEEALGEAGHYSQLRHWRHPAASRRDWPRRRRLVWLRRLWAA